MSDRDSTTKEQASPRRSRQKSTGQPMAPDSGKETEAGDVDDTLPARPRDSLPIVALGGSAGSIAALKEFFEVMPPDSGMAFAVILHLSREHESIMDELLARTTTMRVVQATDGKKVEPNCVYVIPPGKILSLSDGHLTLIELPDERGKRVTIDLFFRALADTHGRCSVAIVLSGAGGDGALGLKRIKEGGGLTIVQDPEEAEHPSMPDAAIATGMVDWVLKVAEMPARLLQYRATEAALKLPAEEDPSPADGQTGVDDKDEQSLREILSHLRSRTGRDFSYYKRATIVRRISRRMQANNVTTLPAYLAFLRAHPGEAGGLKQDLLISVTNFFRDRAHFEALAGQIPKLFAGKGGENAVRVWVAGCATGEEAYSIAILLHEHAAAMDSAPVIQVFATDLDDDAIARARDGLYPSAIIADVSDERLQRFFSKERQGYRVRREVRETVLFAVHDLLKDAPFSKLDLISCRNLLIYLGATAQGRVSNIFHFALRHQGILFLGASESIDDESALFDPISLKHRFYARRAGPHLSLPVPLGPSTLLRAIERQERAHRGPVVQSTAYRGVLAEIQRATESGDTRRVSWEELHFKLIERFAPPSLIVDRDYEIVHVSENAGRFLHFTSGTPSVNLLQVVHRMLRVELRAALFRAAQKSESVEVFRVPVELENKALLVDIRVSPAKEIAPDYLLVVFAVRETGEVALGHVEAEPAVRQLELEIEQMKLRLRDTVEQYEAGSEELKASNEELQAMNEELRSATEELETNREELQSINEELITVNGQLRGKVEELAKTTSDLNNLMAATAIATVFLDRSLNIMRYTPSAVDLFRLIPSDLGRPLMDLTHQLNYPELKDDAERVLQTLIPLKREVFDGVSRWFMVRLLPYRTNDDRIAGAVLTFVDITERREGEKVVEASRRQMEAVLGHMPVGVILSEAPSGRCLYHNQEAERLVGYALPMHSYREFERFGALRADGSCCRVEDYPAARCLLHGEVVDQEEVAHRRPDGRITRLAVSSASVRSEGGDITSVVTVLIDIEARLMAEDALFGSEALLAQSQERLRMIIENAHEYAIFALDLERHVTSWNSGAERILGYTEAEIIGQKGDLIFTPEDRATGAPEREANTATLAGRAADERWHLRKNGTRFWGSGVMMAMRSAEGKVVGLVKIFRDETDRREGEEALERSRHELVSALQAAESARMEAEAAGRSKDNFLAVLSHELRTPLTPVLMAVSILGRQKNLSRGATDALAMIQRNVQLEARFIDDLLDLTRITRGQLELLRQPMNVHEALRHAIEIAGVDIAAKNQRFSVHLAATTHGLIGDTARLQQVFWNLLKNASKFTPDGGEIAVRSRNEGTSGQSAGVIIIDVIDSGIGFEPEVAQRIFDPFIQANEAVTRQYGGLGLGLAISKATVDAHGGALRAESRGLDQGATFTVELPLSD